MVREERNETGFEAKGVNELLPNAATVTGSFATGHAVVIGVGNYRNVCPPLPEAVLNDARDVAAVLTSSAHCGYEPHNVHLLLDGDATLARIRTALASVAETGGPDDTVFIFFSGHGALIGDPADPESALLPVEWNGRTPETTSLSETEFSSVLRRISAQRLLVLIDACHSGGAGSFKGMGPGESPALGYNEKSLGRLAQGTGRVLIASSRASESSWVLPNARNSVLGVPPKLIIFNGFLVGAGAQHCQGQIRQRDRFATTMTIPTRNGDFGATRAGSEWPAPRAHSTACPNA